MLIVSCTAGIDYFKRIVSSCLSHSAVRQMQYYCSLPLLSICNIIIIEFCFRIQLRSTTGKKSHICFFAALKPEFVLQKYSRMVLGYFEVTSLIITLMTSNDKLFDSIQRFPSPQHIKMYDLGVQFIRT